MSTTAYQTNAKPRGRRGSHGDHQPEKPNRSRASSSASTKLSKTLSRNLDELAVPRNSRPSSPAVYLYRQRTMDSKLVDPVVGPSRPPPSSFRPDKTSSSRPEHDNIPTNEPALKAKVSITHNAYDDVHSFEVSEPTPRPRSPARAPIQPAPEATTMSTEGYGAQHSVSVHTSSGLQRKSYSSRSLASMQPTVAEESEENIAVQPPSAIMETAVSTASPPEPAMPGSLSNSLVLDEVVVVSPKTSKSSLYDTTAPIPRNSVSSLHDGVVTSSPRTSKSSLHDLSQIHLPRTSGSSLTEPLVAPTPQGLASFVQPDYNVQEYTGKTIPVSSSPMPIAEVVSYHEDPPRSQSPTGSPPLFPYVHQAMGSPPPQPLQHAQLYPFQYQQPFMGTSQLPPPFYPPPFTSPPMAYAFPGDIPRAMSAGVEDEPSRLLEKVSNVLPDINRLLHYYQESQGLLSEKEDRVKQAENQHMEETSRLRIELSACREEYEKIIREQADENLRLKSQIADVAQGSTFPHEKPRTESRADAELEALRIKCRSLEEEVKDGRSLQENLAAEKKLWETELETWKHRLQEERAQHHRFQTESQQAHDKDVTAMEQEHARSLQDHKISISKIQLDLAGMITTHTAQKKDLDNARSTIAEHERNLREVAREHANAQRLHEEQLRDARKIKEEDATKHKEQGELWSRELSQAIAKHKEELAHQQRDHQGETERIQKAWEQHLLDTKTTYEQQAVTQATEIRDLGSQLEQVKSQLQTERSNQQNLKKELAATQEAHDSLKAQHENTDKHHAELEDSMRMLRSKAIEWQRESERMDQILQKIRQLGLDKVKSNEVLSIPGTFR